MVKKHKRPAQPKRLTITGETVGERIQSVIIVNGLTQTSLAELMGIRPADVSRVCGAGNAIKVETVLLYAAALGVEPGVLMPTK